MENKKKNSKVWGKKQMDEKRQNEEKLKIQ